jgi:hypothetical protein|tara:strand:+ start:707 stop:919 length:213 start_codon:yes stop_codon:yes gene_type:complete
MNQIKYLKYWIDKEKISLNQFDSLPDGFLINGLDKEFQIERINRLKSDLINAEEIDFFYKNINKNIKEVG